MTDIYTALNDLLNRQDIPLDDVLDRHFNPLYRQRTNGIWDNRDAFRCHVQKLRDLVSCVEIEVLDEFTDGKRYADRHIVHVSKRDGSKVVQEVYLFGLFDELGRFERIEETTLMLEGAEADRDIGSAK